MDGLADVVVVGAGAAGCAVARRLADAGLRVVVVESGPGWPGPPALRSLDAVDALARTERFWSARLADRITGAPPSGVPAGEPAARYAQGFGVGGGTAINAMVATSGDRADYDRWASDRGCTGWDGAAMGPWLRRAMAALGRTVAEPGPLADAVTGAARAAGHPVGGASDEPDGVGVMAAALTARDGARRSAADAFGLVARPLGAPDARGRSAGSGLAVGYLEIRAGSRVGRLLTRGRRVVGVALADGTEIAAGSVVLCAGALATPLLLETSGLVAPRRWPVVDHPSFVFTVELRPGARQDPAVPVPAVTSVLRWASGQRASGQRAPGQRAPGLPADLMAMVMDHVGPGVDGRRYGAVIVMLTDVASVGGVATGPGGGVVVDPGWLADPGDRRRFRHGVRHMAHLLGSGALLEVAGSVSLDDQGTPLARLGVMDDDELDSWLAGRPGPVRHPAASVPLAGDAADRPGTALGLDGALSGWDGIHVADAAALPHVPNANPMIPVVAVAQRLAAGLL